MDTETVTNYVLAGGLADRVDIQVHEPHLKFSCPFAPWTHKGTDQNPSFTVTAREDGATFRCFGCGKKGKFWELFTQLSIYSGNPELRKIGEGILAEHNLPSSVVSRVINGMGVPHYVPKVYDMTPLQNWYEENLPFANVCNPGGKYLIDRGFDSESWHEFGFRWDEVDRRVVVPVYALNGGFKGASGRTVCDDDRKWKHYWGTRTELGFVTPYLHSYGGEGSYTYVVVEGPFDALRCWQHIKKMGLADSVLPIAISGCSVSREQIDQIELAQSLTWVIFDHDIAGIKGGNQIHDTLKQRIPRCINLTEKIPPNKDPNELTLNEFQEVITK